MMSANAGQLSHTRADNVLSTFDNNTNATPKGPGIRIKGDFTLDVVIAVNQSAILWRKQGIGQWQQYKIIHIRHALFIIRRRR
jgi:hypothetical protein